MVLTSAASLVLGAALALVLREPASDAFARGESKLKRLQGGLKAEQGSKPETEWSVSPGYQQKVHARGLNYPTRIVFHPKPPAGPEAPLYYVAELPGAIKSVSASGQVRTLINGLLNFRWKPMEELGLLGLDVDPEGASMYLTLAYWDAQAGVYRNRVDRLSLSPDGLQTGSRTTLLDMRNEATVASYQIQFAAVAPDASLYVGVGSGGTKSDAQDLDRFAGKVLRMDRNGKALPDNPFYDAARPDSPRSYTYALGFRNPFDIEWDRDTGVAIVSDVGPGIDRIVRLQRGVNYCFAGGPDGEEQMRANALFTWGPGGSFAPTGLAFVGGPEGTLKRLRVGLFGAVHMPGPNQGKRVLELKLDAEGHLASGPQLATQYKGEYFSSVTDVETAPDGSTYFADIYGMGDDPHEGKAIVYRLSESGPAGRPGVQLVPPNATGGELFTKLGCVACHDLTPSTVKKEGPPLADLASTLDARLNSTTYDALLADLQGRSGAYFEAKRQLYARLRATSGSARVKAWFEQHLADPRFDHLGAKMPSFAHLTKQQVQTLRDYLLP